MLCSYSKAYIKGELNNCKGRASAHSNKGVGVLHYLLFALYIVPSILSLFHLFNLSPLSRGRLGGDVPLRDSVKRLKSAFGNKSICAMGIISYPELA